MQDLGNVFISEFKSYTEDMAESRDYISKAVDMPHLTTTLLTYIFKLNLASTPLLKDIETIKKTVQLASVSSPSSKFF